MAPKKGSGARSHTGGSYRRSQRAILDGIESGRWASLAHAGTLGRTRNLELNGFVWNEQNQLTHIGDETLREHYIRHNLDPDAAADPTVSQNPEFRVPPVEHVQAAEGRAAEAPEPAATAPSRVPLPRRRRGPVSGSNLTPVATLTPRQSVGPRTKRTRGRRGAYNSDSRDRGDDWHERSDREWQDVPAKRRRVADRGDSRGREYRHPAAEPQRGASG